MSSCGVAKKKYLCVQNLHCKCVCSISANQGSVECLWSNVTDVCGKSLEMAHGLGGLIMVGMGMVARSNHGGQE